jgi:hypothetical protein
MLRAMAGALRARAPGARLRHTCACFSCRLADRRFAFTQARARCARRPVTPGARHRGGHRLQARPSRASAPRAPSNAAPDVPLPASQATRPASTLCLPQRALYSQPHRAACARLQRLPAPLCASRHRGLLCASFAPERTAPPPRCVPISRGMEPQAHHAFLHVAASQGAASFPSPPPGRSRAARKPAARAADLPAPPAGAPAGSHVGDAAQARRAASLPPARRFAARAALWAPLTRKP